MRALVVYHSRYGHARRMAEGFAEGAEDAPRAEAMVRGAPKTLPTRVPKAMGALGAQKSMEHIRGCELDGLADPIPLDTTTRFGNMCSQMRQFLDSTGTQHGGQESAMPYGASTIAGPDAGREPTEDGLAASGFQGQWVADIAGRVVGG